MRRQALVLVAALLLAALAVPAIAQDETKYSKCEVPFSFTAGSQEMPAGEYYILQRESGVIEIGTLDNRHVARLVTRDVMLPMPPASTKLVFHQYGEKYFLSRIVRQGDRTGSDVQQPSSERRLALANAAKGKAVELPAK